MDTRADTDRTNRALCGARAGQSEAAACRREHQSGHVGVTSAFYMCRLTEGILARGVAHVSPPEGTYIHVLYIWGVECILEKSNQ
eukprot:2192431-Pyramimonas_sp.AAC.2